MRSLSEPVAMNPADANPPDEPGRHSFESLRRMSVAVDALASKDPAELDDAALADRLVALRQLLDHLEAEGRRCRAALNVRHGG